MCLIDRIREVFSHPTDPAVIKIPLLMPCPTFLQLSASRIKCRHVVTYLKTMRFWCLFTSNNKIMSRESISLTEPNDEWLKAQVENKEYSSKSELVNDLIRQARKQQTQIDWIRAKLETAENSGFTNDSKESILIRLPNILFIRISRLYQKRIPTLRMWS